VDLRKSSIVLLGGLDYKARDNVDFITDIIKAIIA